MDDVSLVQSGSGDLEQDDGAGSGYSGREDVPNSGLSDSERSASGGDDGLSLNFGEREPGSGPGIYYYIKVRMHKMLPRKFRASLRKL